MSEKRLHLDQQLIVWGIAKDGKVIATGMGWRGQELVDERWDPKDHSTGEPAYYHPDQDWTNAATGRPISRHGDYEKTI